TAPVRASNPVSLPLFAPGANFREQESRTQRRRRMPTLRELLIETERAFPTRVAARGAAGEMTYGELSRRVEVLAEDLREMGLAGRRIGILLPNGIAFPVALHGVLRNGGSVLLLNPLST